MLVVGLYMRSRCERMDPSKSTNAVGGCIRISNPSFCSYLILAK